MWIAYLVAIILILLYAPTYKNTVLIMLFKMMAIIVVMTVSLISTFLDA